jgi:hypothetical protein
LFSYTTKIKEGFFASLRMTEQVIFSAAAEACSTEMRKSPAIENGK